MMESGVPVCNSCGEQVGVNPNGELFVACHECNFSICKACVDLEIKEGRKLCLRCGAPYDENSLDDAEVKVSGNRSTMAAHLSDPQEVGLHARHVSSVSTVDSELNDESGNPIWKNRVESWKDKKNKKKKAATKAEIKAERDDQVPSEQQMEEKLSPDAAQPLSAIIPIPSSKLTPYRAVIIMRLIILSLFFHYRITHPVDSAFGLWLTSVICEIWFAFSWVLDQFPKWSPINRETFIERLSASIKPGQAFSTNVLNLDLMSPLTILLYIGPESWSHVTYELHVKLSRLRLNLQRDYEEFKVRINGLVAKAQKTPEEGWTMQDGTSWPGNNTRDHPGMIQVNMKGLDGLQGPVYVGTGCVFNRQALYGYGPSSMPSLPKSSSSSCSWCGCCSCCCPSKKTPKDPSDVYRDAKREELDAAIFNLREIDNYDEHERSMLISQMSFEKTFGLSSVFIESTLMENGGVPESVNPAALINEAIHVISCGYEEKTAWGKEGALLNFLKKSFVNIQNQ
ncbi:hypothetical protein SO802_006480 [Lithocarpus litseifolius]|uniref:Cellulose synthase n=1 Tax=Lithocarpus litseifolius TaxID=425828 RepID=A0AAW2DNJ6_9ROSI